MSGASRQLSNTEASIFFVAAYASAFSRIPDSAGSSISNTGSSALDMENVIQSSCVIALRVAGPVRAADEATLPLTPDRDVIPDGLTYFQRDASRGIRRLPRPRPVSLAPK